MTKMRCKSCHTLHSEYALYKGMCQSCFEFSDEGRVPLYHWANILGGLFIALSIFSFIKGFIP